MRKSTLLSILAIFVLIPLTLFLGTQVKGRWYYLISTMIIIELMLPFFFRFEARRPQARELVILTVMAALAAVSRVVFAFSPYLKTITGIIMITGIAFGPEAGFLTGAVAAFASNFFFSQGPWTPWQMFAYGFGGFFAGLIFHNRRSWTKPWILAPFGFFTILFLVGPMLDSCTVFTMLSKFTVENVLAVYAAGIGYNVTHGIGAALTLFFVSRPLLQKLDRLQTKYGILEL
ncbi:MAG: ECF transporter S component [Faecousia sp.]